MDQGQAVAAGEPGQHLGHRQVNEVERPDLTRIAADDGIGTDGVGQGDHDVGQRHGVDDPEGDAAALDREVEDGRIARAGRRAGTGQGGIGR